MTSTERPDPCVLVLFGATGDLAERMIYPALYRLAAAGRLPASWALVGTGRHEPDDDLADLVRAAITEAVDDLDQTVVDDVAGRARFVVSSADDGTELADLVARREQEVADEAGVEVAEVRRLLYLSIPPEAMGDIVAMLAEVDLTDRARLLVEKPFGHDLESSRELDAAITAVLDEDDVYRVDHFLGEEAVQSLLPLRFANRMLAAIWNREHLASVQIDVPETLGLEGRGSFYESTGCLRDMVSTHLCQILGMVALEEPSDLTPSALRDAKARLFADLQPFEPERSVFGQFEGYRDEDDVDDDSQVETFVALETRIDNDRWRDVPFYLRTGKALASDRRTITLRLRPHDDALFGAPDEPEQIVIELGETAVVQTEVRTKPPGPDLVAAPAALQLDTSAAFADAVPLAAYERLLLGALSGDHLLFARGDEVDRLWQVCQPLLDAPPAVQPYEQGSWGPQAALDLPERGWASGA